MSDSGFNAAHGFVIVLVAAIILITGYHILYVVSDDDDYIDLKSNTINSTTDFIITEEHLVYFNSGFPYHMYSVVDTKTGVEYLTYPGEYMIPRYSTDGEIIIHQDLITTTFS